jgi:hypothetical protein
MANWFALSFPVTNQARECVEQATRRSRMKQQAKQQTWDLLSPLVIGVLLLPPIEK